MLVFRFHKELAGSEVVHRPRIRVHLPFKEAFIEVFALLDSGADRTIIPEKLAQILKLQKGKSIQTLGIGGVTGGYESVADIVFVDIDNQKEKLEQVPVYVLSDFEDVVIGRNKIFTTFRIVIEQYKNNIMLEKIS